MGNRPNTKARAKRPVLTACVALLLFSAAFIVLTSGINALSDSRGMDQMSSLPFPDSTPSYVLLVGSDSRKGTALYNGNENEHGQVDEHGDVITLLYVDPTDYLLTLVTIPSDTIITGENVRVGSYLDSDDPSEIVGAVERLTGVQIPYYMVASLSGFERLIDAVEGTTIDVPADVVINDPSTAGIITVKKGKARHLNGAETLAVVREVDAYGAHADASRQKVVRNIEESVISKVLKYGGELDVDALLRTIRQDCTTNIDLASAGTVMLEFIRNSDKTEVYSCTGPYDGYVSPKTGAWVVKDNPTVWRELMLAVGAGEDPVGIVAEPKV